MMTLRTPELRDTPRSSADPALPPLRVLMVTNMWPTAALPMSGIFVAEQVETLRRRGVQVDVVFVDGRSAGRRAYAAGPAAIRRALVAPPAADRYDILHAHYVFSGIVARAATLIAPRDRRPPILLTHHGIETQVGWTAPLCRWSSQIVARTVVTSRRVQEALGRPDAEIVPCGVDLDLFRPVPVRQARAALGLPVDVPLVLFAGLRRPEKRFDLIEVAVARLRAARPDVQLVVAEREPHERMPLFMSACDVLVLASQAEGSPMVVKEAMACNLPVVSVDVGDVRELVATTAGCYIADPDAESLAARLADALAFGGRTEGRRVVEALSLEAIAAQLERIYREMLATSARSQGKPAR